MPKLLSEIKVTVYGNLRELSFLSTEDIKLWLDAEESFWRGVDSKSMQRNLKNIWDTQLIFYAAMRQRLQIFDDAVVANQEQSARQHNENLRSQFNQVANGLIITSDCAIFPAIADMSRANVDAAGLLYLLARSDNGNTLGAFSNQGIQFKTLFDFILLYSRSKGTRDWLLPQRKELAALKRESQDCLDEIRAKFDEQNEAIGGQRTHANQAQSDREDQWKEFKEKMESEWSVLKSIYDEQLALLAPTQYWGGRAKSHQKLAIGFALAFGGVLMAAVGLFVWLAMPHLLEVAGNKNVSVVMTLVPIAVPAFAGVWVLKILSRLLSENLQMMRDSRERETMVKTFLALMRDDKNGKSIINDNDRILILHSLFRPSSVTAIDDAPPVHWFDILSNKVGPNVSAR